MEHRANSGEVSNLKVLICAEALVRVPLLNALRNRGRIYAHVLQGNKHGQTLIESCVVILFICLIFLGMLEVSQMFAAKEVLHHAAVCGSRAKTVGFNNWMVKKVVRVATIPNAGKMTEPDFTHTDEDLQDMVTSLKPGEVWMKVLGIVPVSQQCALESARVPQYLASDNAAEADTTLSYEDWDTIDASVVDSAVAPGTPPEIHSDVSQQYPLWVPMHNMFYAADTIDLKSEVYLESYYPLYIDDMGW